MREKYTIDEIRNIVTPIAQQYGVGSLYLFGSYSKGIANEKSDVDVHVDKGKIRTLFALTGFRLALEDALKLPVDLITSDISDKEFLKGIADEEVLLYRKALPFHGELSKILGTFTCMRTEILMKKRFGILYWKIFLFYYVGNIDKSTLRSGAHG